MQATKDNFFLAYCFVNFIVGCHPFIKVKFLCGNTECNHVQAQDREVRGVPSDRSLASHTGDG